MEVLFVTFRSTLTPVEYQALARSHEGDYRRLPGLLNMLYYQDVDTGEYGGILFFETREHLEAYLETDLRKSVATEYKVVGSATRRKLTVLSVVRPEKDRVTH